MKEFFRPVWLMVLALYCGIFAGTQCAFAEQKGARACDAKLLMAPPHTSDSILADALAQVIAAELVKRFPLACDLENIIPQDQSRPLFDKIGITAHFAIQPDRIYLEQIEYLKVELRATHFVVVDINEQADNLRVDVREIQKDDTLGKSLLKFDLPYAKTVGPLEKSNEWVRLLAPLSGNAFTLGAVDTRLDMQLSDGYDKIADHTRGVLPPLISSVSVNKIDHFRAFKNYDYSGSIFPSTFFFGIDQDTDIQRSDLAVPDPTQNRTIHVEAYGGCTTILAEGSLHSPIGTTYGGVGFGPCLVQKRQERREPVVYGTTAFRMEFGHRAFFSESWFFYVSSDTLSFSSSAIYESEVATTNSVSRGGIGIGYFIAEKEHLFSSFWR